MEIMRRLARLYNNECFVTHKKFKDKGFVIHHLWYIPGDVERKNYPKGIKGRSKYLEDLEPMVMAQPWRFVLITNGVHTKLDHVKNGVSRLNKENQARFICLMLLTRKR